ALDAVVQGCGIALESGCTGAAGNAGSHGAVAEVWPADEARQLLRDARPVAVGHAGLAGTGKAVPGQGLGRTRPGTVGSGIVERRHEPGEAHLGWPRFQPLDHRSHPRHVLFARRTYGDIGHVYGT